jgi:hypothetical protein
LSTADTSELRTSSSNKHKKGAHITSDYTIIAGSIIVAGEVVNSIKGGTAEGSTYSCLFTAYSLPIQCLFTALFTACSLPIH